VSDWSESYRKASLLVSNMTLAEKTNLTAGSGIYMGRYITNFLLLFSRNIGILMVEL
jgi:beta-glucosidase